MIPTAYIQEWAATTPWPDARLLAADVVYGDDDALEAFERVWFGLIVGLNGEPWHKSEAVIDEFRSTSIPSLLRRAGS